MLLKITETSLIDSSKWAGPTAGGFGGFRRDGQWPAPVIEKHGLTVYRYSVYNALHNNYIPVKPGDYIRVDKPNDVYPIAESVLEKEYEEVNNE